jgi:hypothetical protein
MTRTYAEVQQVLRKIREMVHRFIPDAEVGTTLPFAAPPLGLRYFYAITQIPRPGKKRIKMIFNLDFLEYATWEQIENVVAHEIAHVLAADRYSKKAADYGWHTDEWRDITRALGGTGELGQGLYANVLFKPRYQLRCADCGYITEVPHGEQIMPVPYFFTHRKETGHRKWYVLDKVTGRRWVEYIDDLSEVPQFVQKPIWDSGDYT